MTEPAYTSEDISVLEGLEPAKRRLGLEISLPQERTEVPLTGSYGWDLERIFELYPDARHLALELADGGVFRVSRKCVDLRQPLRQDVLQRFFNKNSELKAVHFPAVAAQPAHVVHRVTEQKTK